MKILKKLTDPKTLVKTKRSVKRLTDPERSVKKN